MSVCLCVQIGEDTLSLNANLFLEFQLNTKEELCEHCSSSSNLYPTSV